jgi:NADH:quinone reductase (non-electrogenic)
MVVVGGGPTGIEFAAELQDFFKEDLEKWFPGIHLNSTTLLTQKLPTNSKSLSSKLSPACYPPSPNPSLMYLITLSYGN